MAHPTPEEISAHISDAQRQMGLGKHVAYETVRGLIDAIYSRSKAAEVGYSIEVRTLHALFEALGLDDDGPLPADIAACPEACEGEGGSAHLIWHLAQRSVDNQSRRIS